MRTARSLSLLVVVASCLSMDTSNLVSAIKSVHVTLMS